MITRMSRINWNKGETDSKTQYDYTRCEIEVPIYANSPKEFGVGTIVCEFGTEALHTQFLQYRDMLPAIVDIEYMPVKKGNNTINQVVAFEFIESCKIDYNKYRNRATQQVQQKVKQVEQP